MDRDTFYEEWDEVGELNVATSFCKALNFMSPELATADRSNWSSRAYRMSSARASFVNRIKTRTNEASDGLLLAFDQANLVVITLQYLNSRDLGALQSMPTSDNIPLDEVMSLPLPFTASSDIDLATCHLPHMTCTSFWEAGEWFGYYTESYFESRSRIAPPMSGIRFSISDARGDRILDLIGQGGRDSVGPFSLTGTLDKASGNLWMEKLYTQ
ncbi:uncharacterized protein KY384_007819 [Bacidia gigantensis]|uniref:uncharacterized protein n=1 Tax=Bacidia gigantensis TaxID=2732470 RepID=UPI001D04D44B|nr:uncharacterized protein KY384_007819 [Bacidia gigantensis]KAG8527666.1 hypothetical protein KY384_007819 [Bacidia gigantensis]